MGSRILMIFFSLFLFACVQEGDPNEDAGNTVLTDDVVDERPFLVSIKRSAYQENPSNESTVIFYVNFSSPVTGVDTSDFYLYGDGDLSAGIASVTEVSEVAYEVNVTVIEGEGYLYLDLYDTDYDIQGVGGTLQDQFVEGDEFFTIDKVGPTIESIVRKSGENTYNNQDTLYFTVTFSEAVKNLDTNSFDVYVKDSAVGRVSKIKDFYNTPDTYEVWVTGVEGTGMLRIDFDDPSVTDSLGNLILDSEVDGTNYYIADSDRPYLIYITNKSGSRPIVEGGTIQFTARFNEYLQSVYTSDFKLTTTGNASGSVSSVYLSKIEEDYVEYTVSVSAGTGAGTIQLDLADTNQSITDLAGNQLSDYEVDGVGVFQIDPSPPVLISIERKDDHSRYRGTGSGAYFTVTFDDDLDNLDHDDFDVVFSGTSTPEIAAGFGSGSGIYETSTPGVYEIRVTGLDDDGVLELQLNDDDNSITNEAGASMVANEMLDYDEDGNGEWDDNITYEDYVIDGTDPTLVSLIRDPSAAKGDSAGNPTDSTNVLFIATFSESVMGADKDDFDLGLSTAGYDPLTNDTIWTSYEKVYVQVIGVNGNGIIDLDFTNSDITDLAGNALDDGGFNYAAGEDIHVATIYPSVTSINRLTADGDTEATALGLDTVQFRVTFSEDVTGVDTGDFALLLNGDIEAEITGISTSTPDSVYDVTVGNISGKGTIRLDLADYDLTIASSSSGNLIANSGVYQGDQLFYIRPPRSGFIQITAGDYHNCGLTSNSRVYCWGRDANGEIGNNDGDTGSETTPQEIYHSSGDSAWYGFKSIDAGRSHTCGVTHEGEVWCWGDNLYQQLGANQGNSDKDYPVKVDFNFSNAKEHIVQVSLGRYHSCALSQQGRVYCWGADGHDQMGDGNSTDVTAYSPQLVTPPDPEDSNQESAEHHFIQISSGYNHACGLRSNGEVWCWGDDGLHQSGDNDGFTTDHPTPVQIADPIGPPNNSANWNIRKISAGRYFNCAVTTDQGTDNYAGQSPVICWGRGINGEMGDASPTTNTFPDAVYMGGDPNAYNMKEVYTGGYHACGLTAAGKVWCWGADTFHGLGVGTEASQRSYPGEIDIVLASTLTSGTSETMGIVQLALGLFHSCALTWEGKVYCWGHNSYGQVGNTGASNPQINLDEDLPVDFTPDEERFKKLAVGPNHSCALSDAGQPYCWGNNDLGQLGDGTDGPGTEKTSPTKMILAGERIIDICTGWYHTCALDLDGTVYCTGSDLAGQQGDGAGGSTSNTISQVSVLTNTVEITCGSFSTCARLNDGSTYCWGDDSQEQMGDAAGPALLETPGEIDPGALTGSWEYKFKKLASSEYGHCGITHNGYARCWGLDGGDDQLGMMDDIDGSTSKWDTPTEYSFRTYERNGNYGAFDKIITQPQGSIPYFTPIEVIAGYSHTSFTVDNSDTDELYIGLDIRVESSNIVSISGMLEDYPSSGETQIITDNTLGSIPTSGDMLYPGGYSTTSFLVDSTIGSSLLTGSGANQNITIGSTTLTTDDVYSASGSFYRVTLNGPLGSTPEGGEDIYIGAESATRTEFYVLEKYKGSFSVDQAISVNGDAEKYVTGITDGPGSFVTISIEDLGYSVTGTEELDIGKDYGHLNRISAIHGGPAGQIFCANAKDGRLHCYGGNGKGQIGQFGIDDTGDDNGDNKHFGWYVRGHLNRLGINKVAAGYEHTCGLSANGKVYCWGSDFFGQAGLNRDPLTFGDQNDDKDINQDDDYSTTVLPIYHIDGKNTDYRFKDIGAGQFYTCGLAVNGKIWCWGKDGFGETADGGTPGTNKDYPTLIDHSPL